MQWISNVLDELARMLGDIYHQTVLLYPLWDIYQITYHSIFYTLCESTANGSKIITDTFPYKISIHFFLMLSWKKELIIIMHV